MIGFSANTWIGAGKAYVKTATSKQTTNKVVRSQSYIRRFHVVDLPGKSVRYGSGSFSGNV